MEKMNLFMIPNVGFLVVFQQIYFYFQETHGTQQIFCKAFVYISPDNQVRLYREIQERLRKTKILCSSFSAINDKRCTEGHGGEVQGGQGSEDSVDYRNDQTIEEDKSREGQAHLTVIVFINISKVVSYVDKH